MADKWQSYEEVATYLLNQKVGTLFLKVDKLQGTGVDKGHIIEQELARNKPGSAPGI